MSHQDLFWGCLIFYKTFSLFDIKPSKTGDFAEKFFSVTCIDPHPSFMIEVPQASKTPYLVTLGGNWLLFYSPKKVEKIAKLPNFFRDFWNFTPETTKTCPDRTQLLIEVMIGGTLLTYPR